VSTGSSSSSGSIGSGQLDNLRVGECLFEHRQPEEMIPMRVGGVDGRKMLPALADLSGELVRLAQRELGIDEQDVALADDHRRVDVVADLALAGVYLERKPCRV